MITINLLPHEKMLSQYFFWAAIVLLIVGLIGELVLVQLNDDLEEKLNMGKRLTHEKHNMFASYTANSDIIEEGYVLKEKEIKLEIAKIEEKIITLHSPVEDFADLLATLAETIPENVWLTKIQKCVKGKLTIEGESIDYTQILEWLAYLQQSPMITSVRLLQFQSSVNIRFNLEVEYGGTK